MVVRSFEAFDAGWRHDAATLGVWLERATAFLGILLILGLFDPILRPDQGDRTSGALLFQAVAGGLYLLSVAVLFVRGVPVWGPRLLLGAWPLVALTLLTLVSTLWSDAPETTFRRAAALVLCSMFAIFIVMRLSLRDLFNLLLIAFAIYVVASLLAVAAGFGITPASDSYAGAWRGVAGHKNFFGRVTALATVLLTVGALFGLLEARRAALLLSAVTFVLVFLSESATSLASVVAGVGIGGLLYVAFGGRLGSARAKLEIGILLLLGSALVAVLVWWFALPLIFEALGRDPTLTGRTKLWIWAVGINEGHTLLGAGYKAFWIDDNTKYFFESFAWSKDQEGDFSDSFGGPTHSHSGYVDTYLELGVPGVALLTVLILSVLATIRRTLSAHRDEVGLVLSVMTAFTLVYASAGESFLEQSEDLWFLFIVFYMYRVKECILTAPSRTGLARTSKVILTPAAAERP